MEGSLSSQSGTFWQKSAGLPDRQGIRVSDVPYTMTGETSEP